MPMLISSTYMIHLNSETDTVISQKALFTVIFFLQITYPSSMLQASWVNHHITNTDVLAAGWVQHVWWTSCSSAARYSFFMKC